MNLSEKSRQIIDSCRFCWMCRHICPIGNATGQERNTTRARAMILSMVNRGSVELTPDIMDNIYECACCSACTCDCVTGRDPVQFVREVRRQAALDQKTPAYIIRLIRNCMQSGNLYGASELDIQLKAAISAHEAKTPLLLYLGSDARYQASADAVNAIRLLEKAGISFTVLLQEPDSGAAMEYLAGGVEETSRMMKEAVAAMNDFDTVVIYEPFDAKVICREYREWNLGLAARTQTFPAFINTLLKDGKLAVTRGREKVTYQDPYILARELNETENAREVIAACGVHCETMNNRKNTVLAGHLIMAQYRPDIIRLATERRLVENRASGASVVVVSSVAEKIAMSQEGKEIRVITLEELVLMHLKEG